MESADPPPLRCGGWRWRQLSTLAFGAKSLVVNLKATWFHSNLPTGPRKQAVGVKYTDTNIHSSPEKSFTTVCTRKTPKYRPRKILNTPINHLFPKLSLLFCNNKYEFKSMVLPNNRGSFNCKHSEKILQLTTAALGMGAAILNHRYGTEFCFISCYFMPNIFTISLQHTIF